MDTLEPEPRTQLLVRHPNEHGGLSLSTPLEVECDCGSGESLAHMVNSETPSAQLEWVEEEEEEDVSPEQATIRVIQQQLQGRDEELIENLLMESEPSSIVSSSIAVVYKLSYLTLFSLGELSSTSVFLQYYIKRYIGLNDEANEKEKRNLVQE
ncbi:hypothetical protein KIL84_009186 [Mauremys mutica]|uniref:Uncharacterized protein n=1 Tax=Mauremys mutica TaxID=74926 RepID=A0A9D3XJU4_9SAUR|nr:hypothetical protein KIL84_009186 [Mauremys mutica]